MEVAHTEDVESERGGDRGQSSNNHNLGSNRRGV